MSEDPKIAAFFARDGDWQPALWALREILLSCPVEEVWKWRAPCYVAHGGNVATLWGLRDGPVLSLFKGVLVADPEGLLEPPGPNSRSARVVRLSGAEEVAERAESLRALILRAVENEAQGLRVTFSEAGPDWPDELTERLDADPELAAAFAALTPGRQRGYVLHFAGAKRPETRAARIDKHAARILAGKGMHDR
ncbi:YdeI/OmpD-associated family protein [Mesobacterium pallidum]|uniref:YdeI/OmpD-associated family protein n=1 Tax=Mesobacterium pallidum TaxID=2872037 RepID=UPI001EE24B8B|nr:YdeI/OmpD-associated family protein [Mesobacterium pallidum]